MNVTFAGNFTRTEIKANDLQEMAEKKLTISLRNGNIFLVMQEEEKQMTFCSRDSQPILLGDGKILFIRYEEAIRSSVEDEIEVFIYHRHKIMTVHTETGLEETVTDRKSFIDCVDGTDEILEMRNPTLSLDGKFLYFVTEKYVTASQLIKVEVETEK